LLTVNVPPSLTTTTIQEIINQEEDGYDNKCDLWALGCVFFEVVFGYTPWAGFNSFETLRNILTFADSDPFVPLEFDTEHALFKDQYSAACIHLIGTLLLPDPTDRPSTDVIFVSAFFKDFDWQALRSEKMEPPGKPVAKQEGTEAMQTLMDNQYDAQIEANEIDVSGFSKDF
jgi:serine/threonine protein kinase